MSEQSLPARRYAVVVPVKPPARGKSRLVGLADEVRRQLAAAFAVDTVTACLSADRVGAVLVATDDAAFAAELVIVGCVTIPDGVADDLNGTLRQAAAEAGRRWPDLQPVALCADLPALRPGDLDAALAAVGDHPAYVPDAAGVGTTLYTAPLDRFDPHFGPASRAAHAETAYEITPAAPSLRRDVDDLADLAAASAMGVGERTAALTGALGLTR